MSTRCEEDLLEAALLLTGEENTPKKVGDDEGIELENIQIGKESSFCGLSSTEAFDRTCNIIHQEILTLKCIDDRWSNNFMKMLQSSSACLNWISLVLMLLQLSLLIVGFVFQDKRTSLPMVELVVMVIMTTINTVLGVREERLKKREIPEKMTRFLKLYQSQDRQDLLSETMLPSIATPVSDSLSLVLTYRNRRLVRLPANLIVEGDIVLLWPGQECPAQLQQVSCSSEKIYEAGEIFDFQFDEPQGQRSLSCEPASCRKLKVIKAPLHNHLRSIFTSCLVRPSSLLENERVYITKSTLELRIIPLILILSFVINLLRYKISRDDFGSFSEMIFLLQADVMIPLLPFMFPLIWIIITCYGTARIFVLFQIKELQVSEKLSLLSREVRNHLWKTLNGDSDTLPRSANLLHTLGSISILCCVNKDGILASPNENSEKLFFFRKRRERRSKKTSYHSQPRGDDYKHGFSTMTNVIEEDEDSSVSPTIQIPHSSNDEENSGIYMQHSQHRDYATVAHPEVLTLSADPNSEFGVVFDDIRWRRHLSSLKPLGLNVLLNTPCLSCFKNNVVKDNDGDNGLYMADVPRYSMRRCLCRLGKQIGFLDSAVDEFERKCNIFAFKTNLNDSSIQSHSFYSKEISKPYLVSVVVEHKKSGLHQLLSQGSADLILDVCTDFWDGTEVHPLTFLERKRIQDFFHRTSLTSNCIALSYRPLMQNWKGLNHDVFLEIPENVEWIYNDSDNGSWSSSMSETSNEKEQCDGQLKDGNKLDTDCYQRIISGQIFIGMITLKHKAKQDIPPLVEDLNRAGIRFVHFSSENEIKSQVFAERLGLETGWNCHISFNEKNAGFDEHSTVTAGSDGKMEDTADEFVVSHVLPAHDDRYMDFDVTCDDDVDKVTNDEDDIYEGVSSGVIVDHVKMMVNREKKGMEEEESKDFRNSFRCFTFTIARDRKLSVTTSSSATTDVDDKDRDGELWFPIGNHAKLPRGVKNIRPHLENVDNVPLLVPLFTDSTPQDVREMISIMQENGEVVCCVGSSLNVDNVEIFNQADVSIAVRPSIPRVCLKDTSCNPNYYQLSGDETLCNTSLLKNENDSLFFCGNFSPLSVSSSLNGISCSLNFHRDCDIKLVALLKEARRLCTGIRVCMTFMLACQLTLSLVMLTSSLFLLPPVLTGFHLLWFTCVLVPVLSVPLINTENDSQLMTAITGKNDKKFSGYVSSFVRYHALPFLPCILVCNAVIFPLILWSICSENTTSFNDDCHYLLGNRSRVNDWNGLAGTYHLALAQDIVAFFLMLCFVFISASYVHHLSHLWKRSPFNNKPWMFAVIIVFVLQLLITTISQFWWRNEMEKKYSIVDLHYSIYCVVFVYPFVQLVFCELCKRKYIKFYIRYQRRAKLKFGTKLGMNSPF
ncbi:transmembrane protein 94-like [Xenia sp. Carnegie-2017]|uniref:transmembrane protein 94-like n=1 Tax=Xenia sp. Carnegie-2017 TaxID=2897299 RepID=UPI001F0364B7|nr:transmembrane protein 94-like [Xenia sp. Carnegie-2017]